MQRYAGEKAKDDPFAKVRIAEAASDIDAAWRQLSGNLAEEYALLLRRQGGSDGVARTGPPRSGARQPAVPSRQSTDSSRAAGATALNDDTPLQRFWRDAHAGRVHAANDAERAYVHVRQPGIRAAARRHDGLIGGPDDIIYSGS